MRRGARRGPRRAPARKVAALGGRIHGEDAALGHLLRDGDLPSRKVDEAREADVLVVGAGVAGLSCAWRLRREGIAATILDSGESPGGNARSGKNAVSAYPWGAHYLRAPTEDHRALEVFLEIKWLRETAHHITRQMDTISYHVTAHHRDIKPERTKLMHTKQF